MHSEMIFNSSIAPPATEYLHFLFNLNTVAKIGRYTDLALRKGRDSMMMMTMLTWRPSFNQEGFGPVLPL